ESELAEQAAVNFCGFLCYVRLITRGRGISARVQQPGLSLLESVKEHEDDVGYHEGLAAQHALRHFHGPWRRNLFYSGQQGKVTHDGHRDVGGCVMLCLRRSSVPPDYTVVTPLTWFPPIYESTLGTRGTERFRIYYSRRWSLTLRIWTVSGIL
ncbi:hypothetical protein BGY98DRAFT_1041364, partial [Russula aff. rugulosa BPL654]